MVGLEPTNEPGHPYNGFIPVTPIMDTQLDDLIIRDLITPLTQRFLKRLKDKIDEQKRENWMEIYFAMFIMMSNIGWVLKDLASVRSWKGLKVSIYLQHVVLFTYLCHFLCSHGSSNKLNRRLELISYSAWFTWRNTHPRLYARL